MEQTPSQSELQTWQNNYGVTHPIVADANFSVTTRFVTGNSIGLPSTTLLGPGGVVKIANGFVRDSDIEALLPE